MKLYSKISIVLVLVIFWKFACFAQNEYNQWIDGFGSGIDFNYEPPQAITFHTGNNYIDVTNSSLCDTNGQLMFYTNGFGIFNRDLQIMENGDSLNIGDYLSYGYDALAIPDGTMIIPFPNDPNKYYIIHTDLNYINVPPYGNLLISTHLFSDVVDISGNNGNGVVIENQKEIVILEDTLINNGVEGVKHGNGRDWWLICHEYGTSRYYRFLIDKDGIHGPYSQDIGMSYNGINAGGGGVFGNMKFNQQGTHFIKNNGDSTVFELYDFDRCSGELSNRKQIKVSDTLYQLEGQSFSPSGRFAYISANHWNYLFQFDLQSADIETSRILIDKYNGFLNPLPVNFYNHALAPDGTIYICSYDGNHSLHVINSPDSAGKKCNFVQNQFVIPNTLYYNAWASGFPNMPNYHLGALEGSACDTTFTALPPINDVAFTQSIYPNPCYKKAQLSITGVNHEVLISIYNTVGNLIYGTTLQPVNGFVHAFINLMDQPAGVYLLKAETDRGEITEKILKE
ncbi:MAG: T9SS type A sorting domain-containing protein [Chitinophagales bacterium]|nr:T9SS type A sorting domain-containing protein [Chitinophagales bacterium]